MRSKAWTSNQERKLPSLKPIDDVSISRYTNAHAVWRPTGQAVLRLLNASQNLSDAVAHECIFKPRCFLIDNRKREKRLLCLASAPPGDSEPTRSVQMPRTLELLRVIHVLKEVHIFWRRFKSTPLTTSKFTHFPGNEGVPLTIHNNLLVSFQAILWPTEAK